MSRNGSPSIAILLATYNGQSFVATQVKSILSQVSVNVHIYIRDDGSTDNTLAIIAELQNASPRRISIMYDELGSTGSAAANFFALLDRVGFESFDYIAFADQDDIWLPGKLQRAVECLSSQGGGGYSSNLVAWNDDTETSWLMRKDGKPKKFDYLFQGASAGCTYVLDIQSALFVRQSIALLARQYLPGVSHDWAIYAICRSARLPWFRDTQSFIKYRQHGGNVYGARPGFAGFAARIRMIGNGWYRNHILWLEQVISNHPDEREILKRLRRGGIRDRLYLAARAYSFRRRSEDVWKLRLAFILGLLGGESE